MKPTVPLVFLLLTPLAEAGAADGLGQLTVPKTQIDVLAGRLKVSVPTGARLQPVQHGIMAAPEADNEQTRVLIDAGDQRMVLMVYELFARAAADFEGEAQKETARFPMKVNLQKWTLSGPVRAIAYFPVVPAKDQEANLVMGVFVAGPDGSVQNLVWYVNPAGAIPFSAASNLAESIAKTIAPGARTLDITPGARELSVYSKTKSVFVTVPQGYVVTAQHGPDSSMENRSTLALTSLRNIIGQHDLDEVLQERDKINGLLRENIANSTTRWGIEVERFEMKDVELPAEMQYVMAMQAEAIREKRTRIIKAEAELEASEKLSAASAQMAGNPAALELRRMQMVAEVGAENNRHRRFDDSLGFRDPIEVP